MESILSAKNKDGKYGLKDMNLAMTVLLVWVVVWCIYNGTVRRWFADPLHGDICSRWLRIELPWGEAIDGWSVNHVIIYLTLGLFVPDAYLTIAVISIVFEIFEHFAGWTGKWSDPFVNMLGYVIGSWLHHKMALAPVASHAAETLQGSHVTVGLFVMAVALAIMAPTPASLKKSQIHLSKHRIRS